MRLRWSGLSGSVDEAYGDAALGGQERCVHVGHRLLDDVAEDPLEGGELEHLDVVLGDLAADLDVDLLRDLAREPGEDAAELLGERDARPDVLVDETALHVHRVRDQLPAERQPDRARDRHPGLLLRLLGGGAEVRGGHDVLELEQRAVGARLLGEHVEPGGADAALLEGVVERLLVDDAAARGVDEHEVGAGLGELVLADEPEGLRGLRQVHRHEVGLLDELLEGHQAHAHLGGTAGLHVGVVGDDPHPEGAQPLRDEHADAAEADDADGLLVELDAGVPAALPLAVLQRLAGRADVAGRREHEGDRELGRGDDVGGRGVDDHDAALRRGLDVDVVEPDAGAGHDREPLGGGERLGVHLRRRPDEERVDVDDRGEELVAVGPVAVPDLEVRAQRVEGRGAQLFGDQDDGLAHVTFLTGCRSDGGADVRGGVSRGWLHDAVPDRGCYPTGLGEPGRREGWDDGPHDGPLGLPRHHRDRDLRGHGDQLPRHHRRPGQHAGVLVPRAARGHRVRRSVRRPQGLRRGVGSSS